MALTTPSDFLTEVNAADVPAEYRREFIEIVALTDSFCTACLNEERQQLCRTMAVAICQAGSPVNRGKRSGWACGIVYSVGWVNFLTECSPSAAGSNSRFHRLHTPPAAMRSPPPASDDRHHATCDGNDIASAGGQPTGMQSAKVC